MVFPSQYNSRTELYNLLSGSGGSGTTGDTELKTLGFTLATPRTINPVLNSSPTAGTVLSLNEDGVSDTSWSFDITGRNPTGSSQLYVMSTWTFGWPNSTLLNAAHSFAIKFFVNGSWASNAWEYSLSGGETYSPVVEQDTFGSLSNSTTGNKITQTSDFIVRQDLPTSGLVTLQWKMVRDDTSFQDVLLKSVFVTYEFREL